MLAQETCATAATSGYYRRIYRGRLTRLLQEGRLKFREDVAEGLEYAPKAFIGMMRGEDFGALLGRVSKE